MNLGFGRQWPAPIRPSKCAARRQNARAPDRDAADQRPQSFPPLPCGSCMRRPSAGERAVDRGCHITINEDAAPQQRAEDDRDGQPTRKGLSSMPPAVEASATSTALAKQWTAHSPDRPIAKRSSWGKRANQERRIAGCIERPSRPNRATLQYYISKNSRADIARRPSVSHNRGKRALPPVVTVRTKRPATRPRRYARRSCHSPG